MVKSTLLSKSLIEIQFWKNKIQALICAGYCGSLIKKISLGDIIVGTSSIEHDYKLKYASTPLPEIPSCPELLKIFKDDHFTFKNSNFQEKEKNLTSHFLFHVYKGPIASGDEDIIHPHQAQNIHKQTSAWGVSWEGIGGAKAAKK